MCVGNACGGMSTTTIYPSSIGDPGLLIMIIAGIAVSMIVFSLFIHRDTLSAWGMPRCFGI